MKTVEDMKRKGNFDKSKLAELGINVRGDETPEQFEQVRASTIQERTRTSPEMSPPRANKKPQSNHDIGRLMAKQKAEMQNLVNDEEEQSR